MKSLLISILALGLAISAGLLFVQRHRYQALYERQDQAIALVQSKYDALLRESQTAQRTDGKRKLAQSALSRAQTLAPRYEALNRITGYTKKVSQK
ncbi:MAG: hypothetical protein PHC88_07475 [Terrimicrobiaceae bacterium]|nr:hypothetical protein [Terrimicrobiaceae bacterium]